MTIIPIPDCLVQLNNVLHVIDDAPVECDGHTLMVSSALKHAGISHQRICGVLRNPKTNFKLPLHFWIQVGEFILDYRLKMWVGFYSGEELAKCAPHGIFQDQGHDYQYTFGTLFPPTELEFNLLNFISDGFYGKINLTELKGLAHSVNLITGVKKGV